MAIIRELKGLSSIAGTMREISDILGRPRKVLRELVGIGLPSWDPPEEAPPSPPDQATVDRAKGAIAMSTTQERQALTKVMTTWRKISTGAPSEMPRPGAPPGPPAPPAAPPPQK